MASICNAIMDTVDHHFSESIFEDLVEARLRLWFNASKGWLNKYIDRDVSKGLVQWKIFGRSFNKPVQFSDCWHYSKALMVIFVCMAISIAYYCSLNLSFIEIVILLCIYGTVWNVTFTEYYERKLLRKFKKGRLLNLFGKFAVYVLKRVI